MTGIKALIPLDGTALSEAALGTLSFLQSLGTDEVRLVSVWDEIEVPLAGRDPELEEAKARGTAFLQAYLREKAGLAAAPGLKVDCAVRVGAAGTQLLQEADAYKPDIVVIATHGRTAVERWRLGSVAEKVIRGVDCPVLVIGPNVITVLDPYKVERVVAPVDGSPIGEEALPIATAVCERLKAQLELVQVVHLPATWGADPMFQPNPVEVVNWLEEGAQEYLGQLLPDQNPIRTVLKSAATGGVSYDLNEYLHEQPADLIVMSSHGRHGFTRAVLGSVADAMLRGPAPVLLVKPGGKELARLIAQSN